MFARNTLIGITLALWTAAAAWAEAPAKKVMILGIDGCRTDALRAAQAPNLHQLIREGAIAENTRVVSERETGADTVSGPGWSSILTGVWADKHGVKDNSFRGANYDQFPHFFRRLKAARPDAMTVSLETWGPIHQKIVSAANASFWLRGEKEDYATGDRRVAAEASRLLTDKNPDTMFVYFGNVDETGHRHGFHPNVKPYMQALEEVDKHVGTVLEAMRARPGFRNEDWLTIVCTDHGGIGTGHGGGHKTPEVNTVFLIVSGASAQKGMIDGPTRLVDVSATALRHLGVEIDSSWEWDGRPIGLK